MVNSWNADTCLSAKFSRLSRSVKDISGMAGPLAILAAINELVDTDIVRV